MAEERENLLTLVLDSFARDSSEISVFGSDGTNIFLSKHILMLFSPFVSTLLSSTSPCLESALIVPDISTDSLLTIGEILENGFTTTYNKSDSSEVTEAAKLLEIDMVNLAIIDNSVSNNQMLDLLVEKNVNDIDSNEDIDESASYDDSWDVDYENGDELRGRSNEMPLKEEKDLLKVDNSDFQFSDMIAKNRERFQDFANGDNETVTEFLIADDSLVTNLSNSDHETFTQEEEKVDRHVKKKEKYSCQICQRIGPASTILMCYTNHFLQEMKVLVDPLLNGLQCTICDETLINRNYAVKHIATIHGKVNVLLEKKGIPQIHRRPRRKPLAKGLRLKRKDNDSTYGKESKNASYNTDMDVVEKLLQSIAPIQSGGKVDSLLVEPEQSETKCELCGREVRTKGKLWTHYHGHLAYTVRRKFADLLVSYGENTGCSICGHESKTLMSVVAHISMTHGKLNDVLIEKGIKPLARQKKKPYEVSL